MKNIVLSAIFLGFTMMGFAQPTFTEKTIQDMNQHLVANPLKFLTEEIDPSFTLIGDKGNIAPYENFKRLYAVSGFKMNEWTTSDVKIKQFGKTAIVTGLKKHTMSIQDTVIHSMAERFTYFYEFNNNKWMWTYGQHTPVQPADFTEKTFKDMLGQWQKDGVAFLKNETTPDFMFVGTGGFVKNRDEFINFVQGGTTLSSEFTNIKIRQYNSTAIVTGSWAHSHRLKHNNSVVSYNELVTETFVYQKDKWLYASHQSSDAPTAQTDEKAAVQKAIENESHEFHFNTDRNSFLKSWTMADGTIMCYSGKAAQVVLSNKDMKGAAENGTIPKANNEVTTFANYNIRVSGNTAWATFDQTSAAGNVTHEFRCMEKVGNDWKIVSSSVHDTAK